MLYTLGIECIRLPKKGKIKVTVAFPWTQDSQRGQEAVIPSKIASPQNMRSVDPLQSACLRRENSSPVRNQMGRCTTYWRQASRQSTQTRSPVGPKLRSGPPAANERGNVPPEFSQIANSSSDDCFYRFAIFSVQKTASLVPTWLAAFIAQDKCPSLLIFIVASVLPFLCSRLYYSGRINEEMDANIFISNSSPQTRSGERNKAIWL